jgi:hypothetical protein
MRRKYGDLREDGYRFRGYRKNRKGETTEAWYSPAAWERQAACVKKHNKIKVEKAKKDPKVRAANNEALREYLKTDPRRSLLYAAKRRAKLSGLPFDLCVEDIAIPEFCPALGLRLIRATDKVDPCSISLDRVVPDFGYVKGNVIVVSHLANTIKNNATPDQILSVGEFYKQLLRE